MAMSKQQVRRLRKARKISGTIIGTIMKVVVCVFFGFPFLWMVATSFKTNAEAIQFPPTLLPVKATIEAYISVFSELNLGRYIGNSLLILVATTVGQFLVMVPAAYAFAKYKFKGNGFFFGLLMVAFMVPTVITYPSVSKMFMEAGMIKTLIPQIVPCLCNAFGIFLLRQNFMQVPEELLESARLDEASELQIITKIMLPMSKATLSNVMMLSVIGTWNSYFWPLVMTYHDEVRPITIAIESMKTLEGGLQWPIIMAGNCILVLPVLLLFLAASKKIIAAMAYRGVK
ncbi:MAG: carbohydrate ABC transporter permease [Ruminococcaceae bacterium]|nr:carbohydrate ABC transporter permease [Oscillospiraceae bacterium]